MRKAGQKTRKSQAAEGQSWGQDLAIRFTKAEAEQLAEVAKNDNRTDSEWIRRAVLAVLGAK